MSHKRNNRKDPRKKARQVSAAQRKAAFDALTPAEKIEQQLFFRRRYNKQRYS